MIWKYIYFCNPPKSVFPTLCQFVPSEAKLSDCQREYSNLPYSAFYPIILFKNPSFFSAFPCFPTAAGILRKTLPHGLPYPESGSRRFCL